jgi:protocadherin Fat 4
MSHLSDSSGSDLNSSARARRHRRQKKKEDMDRRHQGLVNTMDSVSVTSSQRKQNKFNEMLETNTELLHDDNSSSDSPSENDSFTCSEYDYEAPYDGAKQLDHSSQAGAGGMVFRKLNPSDNEKRGSLTTLTVSDDDLSLSGFGATNGPSSWEQLLNWSPNFNTFVGVFKDIAELPDLDSDIRPNPLGDREDEQYI